MVSETNFFVPPGHFYSPIVSAEEAKSHIETIWKLQAPILGIEIDDDLMKRNWANLSKAADDIPYTDKKKNKYRYYYQNDQFAHGDACIYYAYLKHLMPKNIIEIGSGYSSALALDACEQFNKDVNLTFIEPFPDRLNMLLRKADNERVTLIKDKVQNTKTEIYESLGKNDILFIDSSHVAKTGSDVCFEIFEIIPRLKPGVHIVIHDMFYPFEYPMRWAVDENRSWNEIYLIRAFLMNNKSISIEFFNHYFGLKFPDICKKTCPLFMKNTGGSLWLKVV